MPLATDVNAATDMNTAVYCTLQNMNASPVDNIVVGAGLLIFFIGLIVFRYKAILSPSRRRLETELQALKAKIAAYSDAKAGSGMAREQKSIIEVIETKNLQLTKCDRCFISSGKIISGWRMLHIAKNIIFDDVVDIKEQLEIVRVRLAELDQAEAKSLAERIKLSLEQAGAGEQSLRQLLVEGQRVYYEYRDDYYEMLADWQNKAMWLTYITVLFIALLLWVETNAMLLVAGGIGGLLSKLRSVIQKPDIPNDYGFSWSTLFLTPLIGVLTGWAGVYMVIVMMDVGVFGDIFTKVLSESQGCPFAASMVITIVFGYSAGLFEKMLSNVEEYATKEKNRIEKRTTKADESND